LARTEAVGLCFSDMKLLKQFGDHPRKAEVMQGVPLDVLKELPSYKPGNEPTVPGHELALRIVAVGPEVEGYRVGERWLVQPDFRNLKTPGSNGACGYNFEGALQEYVLLDERVVGKPNDGECYMIKARDDLSASSVALVEPWACVENSYVTPERNRIRKDGRLLVIADRGRSVQGLTRSFDPEGDPREIAAYLADEDLDDAAAAISLPYTRVTDLNALTAESFDDVVYFGSDPEILEIVSDKLTTNGTVNVVLGGEKLGRKVNIGVGRIHYGYTRWVGTAGDDAHLGYEMIPATGEVRDKDRVLVVGAGGPMGQMHVIRSLSLPAKTVSVVASDMDDERLKTIAEKAGNLAGDRVETVNAAQGDPSGNFNYVALMAPVPKLLDQAIELATPDAIINVFAGIPAPTKHPIDLDTVIGKRVFVYGTSGSAPEDMKTVLAKVENQTLDTDSSVAAVSGMAGAKAGLKAVEDRTMDGKIIVYPSLKQLDLTPLAQLESKYPSVFAKLENGQWNKAAEEELLRVAK
ncbi:MAG: alcohol dehydrogenase catalytic domain-containing protein, partial [Fimbriimonadaceae bacterium]